MVVSRKFCRFKKSFAAHLFTSPVLLTKFWLSASLVWSLGLIEKLAIWSCDLFQKKKQEEANYTLLDFIFAEEPKTGKGFDVDLLYFVIIWYFVYQ